MGNDRWRTFRSLYRETDLWVAVCKEDFNKDIEAFTSERIRYYRNVLEDHILKQPRFKNSLVPVPVLAGADPIVNEMYRASEAASIGPMASVAGAVAEFICNDLIKKFPIREIVIENGGDIFFKLTSEAIISVYAGESPLSEKVSLMLKPHDTPVSVCTSSATVGHSLSFGKADACMIACHSAALADAYATAFCNQVKNKEMVLEITENALKKSEILSVVIIMNDRVGLGGKLAFNLLK